MRETIAVPKTEMIDGIPKYDVEDAARVLERAQEIRAKPKLLRAAIKVLVQKQNATAKALGWAKNMK